MTTHQKLGHPHRAIVAARARPGPGLASSCTRTRPLSPSIMLSLGLSLLASALPGLAFGHPGSGCPHTHVRLTRVECSPRAGGQPCTAPDGQAGVCREYVGSGWRDCLCLVPGKKASTCALFYNADNPISIPGVNHFVLNETAQNECGSLVGLSPHPTMVATSGLSGFLTLQFEPGEDPTQIPVRVVNFDASFPSFRLRGRETGSNHILLDPQLAPGFVFNAHTNELSTPAPLTGRNVNSVFPEGLAGSALLHGSLNPATGELFLIMQSIAPLPRMLPPPGPQREPEQEGDDLE